jgi:hypothetical protein
MDSSGEDARKKRDCAQVEQKEEEENPKKVRVQASRKLSPKRRLVPDPAARQESSPKARSLEGSLAAATPGIAEASSSRTSSSNNECKKVWDLESALLYLVQVDASCKEFLSKTDGSSTSWVTFRVGHAGDASTIANLYRQSKRRNLQDENPELEIRPTHIEGGEEESPTSSSSMLEIWLADGMGDEDTPPSMYSLMAHVHTTSNPTSSSESPKVVTTSLGAISLLTLAWADEERILRVEWMHVDPSLPQEVSSTLEQRLWLRLSSLALMTACQVLTVDKQFTSAKTSAEIGTAKRLPPSAE